MPSDPYCKIYVLLDPVPEGGVAPWIAERLAAAEVSRRTVTTPHLVIDVFRQPAGQAERFVEWPIYLEVEPPNQTAPFDVFVAAIRDLLKALRTSGALAIASCDFEDLLVA